MKNNLKSIREKAKLSLQDLANVCGVTRQHVHALEKDSANPTLKTAYAVSAVLSKDVYQIWPDSTEIIEETITVKRVKQAV